MFQAIELAYVTIISDKRVENWFLMQTYTPTLLLVLAYLVSIWLGKKLMANREPFQLKGLLFAYNVCLVILNAHIVYEVRQQFYFNL